MLNVYITSSSKKSGKTFISAGLAATMKSLGYSTSVYKPVQTAGIERNGFAQSPDLTYIKTIDPYINTAFSYIFKTAAEPITAAEMEGEVIDSGIILRDYQKIISASECTVIDGEGGILSPLAPDFQNTDLIKMLKIPVLIVTTPNEDAVNSTLLTIEQCKSNYIDIRGVVINNITKDCPKHLLTSIPQIIEEYTDAKVLGLVEALEDKIKPEDLITSILNGIDIESVFNVKIEKLDYAQ